MIFQAYRLLKQRYACISLFQPKKPLKRKCGRGEIFLKGKLIVIEGLDGSGKATQAQALVQALKEMGVPAKKVSFPVYDSDSSALVRMYLAGEFGKDPSDVNAYAASTFFSVDRYASYKKDWGKFYLDGGVVVADRYTTSNAIHQCCKLPESDWEDYLDWLFRFEYEMLSIPAPDQVIYLKVDVEESQKLMSGRYHGDESKKDIHEGNLEYLRKSRRAADYCACRMGWKTVDCFRNGAMRTIGDIHEEVMKLISR